MGCHPRVRNDQPGHDRTSPWSEWLISIMALQIVNFSAIIIIYSVIILMTVLFFFFTFIIDYNCQDYNKQYIAVLAN